MSDEELEVLSNGLVVATPTTSSPGTLDRFVPPQRLQDAPPHEGSLSGFMGFPPRPCSEVITMNGSAFEGLLSAHARNQRDQAAHHQATIEVITSNASQQLSAVTTSFNTMLSSAVERLTEQSQSARDASERQQSALQDFMLKCLDRLQPPEDRSHGRR